MNAKIALADLKHKNYGAVVVSAGGHLEQALRRVNQLGIEKKVKFFTPMNSQTTSKLRDIPHVYNENVGSRDLRGFFVAFFQLTKIIRKKDFDFVISTGAGVAISAFLACKLRNVDFFYIESIARQEYPSMTGKILSWFGSPNLYTESKKFNSNKWKPIDSLFSNYKVEKNSKIDIVQQDLELFVTVGTVHKYHFSRMVRMVKDISTSTDVIHWQVGNLESENVEDKFHLEVTDEEFKQLVVTSHVVITHAGVGSILNILDLGKFPIIVPRLSRHLEHVDDHQLEIATMVENLGLAKVIHDNLSREDLISASRLRISK